MSKDPMDELLQFLKPDVRIDLKHLALNHLLCISGTEHGVNVLLNRDRIIQSVIELSDDKVEEIAKSALLLLVNVSSSPQGSVELLKYRSSASKTIIELCIGYVLDPQKKNADAACMILSNITRLECTLETCVDKFLPHLNDILNAYVNTKFNKTGSDLNYLSPMFSNLSRSPRIRKWLIEENPYIPLIKLLPFCKYKASEIRRGGTIGTIRNLTFDTQYHKFLLSNDLDLLTYILYPLMGGEDYDDEEMYKLPISLQYLPHDKTRDPDVDIRKLLLETLNKLCARRECREILRNNGVYYVLREYHKWEKDPEVRLACENVVDILIQKEDEVGAEDLSSVEVPADMVKKFNEIDNQYLAGQ